MNTESMDEGMDDYFGSEPSSKRQRSDPRVDHVLSITALLTKGQGRRFDEEDIHLWANLLEGVDADLAREATVELLKNSTDFISAALIRQEAQKIGQARLRAVGHPPEPPSRLSSEEYTEWLRSWRKAVMKGATEPEAERAALTAIGPEALKHLDRAESARSIQPRALNMVSQEDLAP